jgi:protein-disulfide isomerase
MTLTITILILLIGMALFILGGLLFTFAGKKVSTGKNFVQKLLSAFGVVIIAGAVVQLWTPVYLTSVNPEMIKDMADSYEEYMKEQQSKEVREYVKDHMDEMIANAPIVGDVEAKNTIFLWSDYSCPYCRRVHAELVKVMEENKDVRVVLKNFSIHGALSDAPAKAVIAAKIQDNAKAAELDRLLMAKEYYTQEDLKNQAKLADTIQANVMKLAKEAGLDTKKLAEDMKGDVVRAELMNVRMLAQQFGIQGTPYLIVNDTAFPGMVPAHVIIDALK